MGSVARVTFARSNLVWSIFCESTMGWAWNEILRNVPQKERGIQFLTIRVKVCKCDMAIPWHPVFTRQWDAFCRIVPNISWLVFATAYVKTFHASLGFRQWRLAAQSSSFAQRSLIVFPGSGWIATLGASAEERQIWLSKTKNRKKQLRSGSYVNLYALTIGGNESTITGAPSFVAVVVLTEGTIFRTPHHILCYPL